MPFLLVKLNSAGQPDYKTANVAADQDEARLLAKQMGEGTIRVYQQVLEVDAVCNMQFTERTTQ